MKKIIDKNGRLFGVISIIDVAVLLVVAVMALALYVRGNRSVTGTTLSDELISFQMVIDDVYSISKGKLVGRPWK